MNYLKYEKLKDSIIKDSYKLFNECYDKKFELEKKLKEQKFYNIFKKRFLKKQIELYRKKLVSQSNYIITANTKMDEILKKLEDFGLENVSENLAKIIVVSSLAFIILFDRR